MSLRTTPGTTGLMRSVSLITASRYSPSLARVDLVLQPRQLAGGRAAAARRPRRAMVAVVSWPATSSVISSSRSSSSVSGAAVLVARLQQDRQDVVAVGDVGGSCAPAARSRRRSARRPRRAGSGSVVQTPRADRAAHRRERDRGQRSGSACRCRASAPSRSRSRASRSASSMPNTVRMMISSVIACVRGRSPNGSPTGHSSISRSAISRITLAVALHPLAVERGQHQLALAHVLAPVEQQHRVAAHDRLERRRVRLARVQARRGRR